MHKSILLNTQKKQLHEVLIKFGIDISRSHWSNEKMKWTNSECETLHIENCHFLFNPNYDGLFNMHVKPALNGGVQQGEVSLTWSEIFTHFMRWSSLVKKEIEQEDPWLIYQSFIKPEDIPQFSNNNPYTYQEVQQLSNTLIQFNSYLEKQLVGYKGEIKKVFDEQLSNLEDNAKKGIGRVDWSNSFMGMLLSLSISLSLSPEQSAEIWRYWIQLIRGILMLN